jgi:hypothetical protein
LWTAEAPEYGRYLLDEQGQIVPPRIVASSDDEGAQWLGGSSDIE